MDGTILGQGTFTASSFGLANPNPGNAEQSNAVQTIIQIPSGADWLRVFNYTQFGVAGWAGAAYFNGTANADVGVEFWWQRGMAAGTGIVKYKAAATAVLSGDTLASGGFTLYDPSGTSTGAQPLLSAPVATTASTNVTRPIVSTGNTAGVSVGTVVRLYGTAQTDVNGVDFVVGAVTANTSFTLLTASNALATAPGAIGGAGFYSIVYNGNSQLFYPRRRTIVNISQAANAQVGTSVAHGLTVGQEVRFNIPSVSGMTQLNADPLNNYFPSNSLVPAIVMSVVDDYNFTININTTAYTAFTYPTIAQQPSSFPIVVPIGEDTATSLSSASAQVPMIGGQQIFNTNSQILADSTVNTGYLGMILGIGGLGIEAAAVPLIGPAGSIAWSAGNAPTGDILYWVAGKSTFGGL
ncbi:MAG: hypothetical protein ACHQVS_00525 [Candidatus Babeliales bacterium]